MVLPMFLNGFEDPDERTDLGIIYPPPEFRRLGIQIVLSDSPRQLWRRIKETAGYVLDEYNRASIVNIQFKTSSVIPPTTIKRKLQKAVDDLNAVKQDSICRIERLWVE